MKELSIEEKARAYDEAIKKAAALYKASEPMSGCNVIIETLFPELVESEGEKIRKWCISHFKECINVIKDNDEYKEYLSNKVLAWLERQGEHANFRNKIQVGDKVTRNEAGVLINLSQLNRVAKKNEKQCETFPVLSNSSNIGKDEHKPTNWSEEDEDMRYKAKAVINRLCAEGKEYVWSIETLKKIFNWLNFLKDRVQPQPKQEWSRDDEQYLLVCKNALAKYQTTDKWDAGIISRWLEDKLKSLRQRKGE